MSEYFDGDAYGGPAPLDSGRLVSVIALFWIVQFITLTAERLIATSGDDLAFLAPRACVALAGIAITMGIEHALRPLFGRRLPIKFAAAVGLAMVAALLHGAANFAIFQAFMPERNLDNATLHSYFAAIIGWFWTYSAACALLLALIYNRELGHSQRIAHKAQLLALRYQLNPHFMFNTLNSIASLISRRELPPAERMVEDLADFLRATLTLDPAQDITLDREIGLQSLYLEIERLRFSGRLVVELDIAEEAASALVPSLITQPLAENVIRHAVATSTRPVVLAISARRDGPRLRLVIRNSGSDGHRSAGGTGVGLANVADRLRARYGSNHEFRAGAEPLSGFSVEIVIPFVNGSGG